jgi:tetratricopeptide (TPR) repeat protein
MVYKDQGRLAEAESLYQRALANVEHAPGSHRPTLARILDNMAFLYQADGKFAGAEAFSERALTIREHPKPTIGEKTFARLSR